VDVGILLHSSLVSDSYDKKLVLDLLQSLFLHYLLLWFPDYLYRMYYIEVLDYTMITRYCTAMVLCIAMQDYTIVSLETVAHYTVVVL